jgi:hypothetical protein
MRIRDLLGPAARGAVRLLMESAWATPRRIYIGAGVAALVAGIGANALLVQIGGHPAPLLAPVTHDPLPASERPLLREPLSQLPCMCPQLRSRTTT